MNVSRRHVLFGLAGLAVAGLWPRNVLGFGARSLFEMPTMVYDGPWEARKGATSRLAWELMKRTSVEAKLEQAEVRLSSPTLFETPFLYMSGDGAFQPFSNEDADRLRRFLLFGGFLFIDGNLEAGNGFDQSVRREMARIFPEWPLATLPQDHTLFKSFYLLDGRWGRVQNKTFVEGVTVDNRTVAVYSQNDVGGAWMRDNFGNWRLPVIPGGDRQREMAFRFGVNVAMYSLCTNYKSDQVHIPFILRRTRR